MENSDLSSAEQANKDTKSKKLVPLVLFVMALILLVGAFWQLSGGEAENRALDIEEATKAPVESPVVPVTEVIIEKTEHTIEAPFAEVNEEETIVSSVENLEPIENPVKVLPTLDESDSWLQSKLADLTWRKELLKLVIDEDMIRRFVVFTDNFAQGIIAYEHSPFTLPKSKFSPNTEQVSYETKQNVWQWDDNSSKRFNLYVALLRSMDSESLVQWYFEIKPLIDEAYSELGYDDDFTSTLQDAIVRVLDMELPKSSMVLTRPSVMYKFYDKELEALPASNKLLLRLGKENLLIIKSILLEINEKLAQKNNGIS